MVDFITSATFTCLHHPSLHFACQALRNHGDLNTSIGHDARLLQNFRKEPSYLGAVDISPDQA